MVSESLQRLAILLMLFGGILHLQGAIQGNYAEWLWLGEPIMFLALVVGLVAFVEGGDPE